MHCSCKCSAHAILFLLLASAPVLAQDRQPVQRPVAPQRPMQRIPDTIRTELDLPYAGTDNPRQRLDLYLPKLPKSQKPLPVVAFIHGGGWQNGDKRGGSGQVASLVESGEYAGVSIG
jgi:acetyl esterase/lipase